MVGHPVKKLRFEELSDTEKGYLIGFFIGDGYCYYSEKDRHYMVEFHFNSIRDIQISNHVKSILRKLGTKYFDHIDKRFNSLRIRVNSKELFNFVKLKTIEFNKSKLVSKNYKLGLISGFIDADGYVTRGTIQLTQKNKKTILKFIRIFPWITNNKRHHSVNFTISK